MTGVRARRHLSRLPVTRRATASIRSGPRRCSPRPATGMPPATSIRRRFRSAEVELIYNTSENNRQIAEFVQAQWKQNLGLTMPLKNMEFRTFSCPDRASSSIKGLARGGWIGDYLDPFTFLASVSTPRRRQRHGWSDPEFVRHAGEGESPDRSRHDATRCWRDAEAICSTHSRCCRCTRSAPTG